MEPPASPPLQPTTDLSLSPERWALIRPKLAALLAELSKMEELGGWEAEPDTADAWGDAAVPAKHEVPGER